MIDGIGDGAGVYSRLREKSYFVWNVKNSESAVDKLKFANKKAEHFWKLREWVRKGGCLSDDSSWDELKNIKYRHVFRRTCWTNILYRPKFL